MHMLRVGPDTEVWLNFAIHLESGETIDSNMDLPSVSFKIGDGKLLPGFEKCLMGMQAGQHERFTLGPQDAFGHHMEDNLQRFSKAEFQLPEPFELGLVIEFADPSQGNIPGVVTSIEEDTVEIDFNHPLAGRTLVFEVRVEDVRAAKCH